MALSPRPVDAHEVKPGAPSAPLERTALAIAALATVAFAAAQAWELAGPFGAGHVASSTAVGIAAENMLRWRTLAPVTHYTAGAPTTADWYCHHPFGIFWLQVPLSALLGHRDLACRLPPILLSAATPPLLYAIARRLWSPVAGALAATAFAVLPIALAFGAFNALEVPVIFGTALSLLGTVRFVETRARRDLAMSLAGLALAMNADWSAWIYAAALLALTLPSAVRSRDLRRWWVLSAALFVAIALCYLAVLARAGKLPELAWQARFRSRGASDPLGAVLASRARWIELCFTPTAIALGKLAAPVMLARAVVRRRLVEALPLTILAMATLQYVVFREGADVHVFWPQLFAPWFALAVAALAATVEDAGRRARRRASLAALALGLAVCGAILPDGLAALGWGRRSGLRFDEKGLYIDAALDETAAMRWLAPRVPEGAAVAIDASVRHSWALDWALRRPTVDVRACTGALDHGRSPFCVADRRALDGAQQRELASRAAVTAVGPLAIVEVGAPPAPAVAYAIARREPTTLEALLVGAHDPVLRVAPDPWATWELRRHLEQQPNDPPPIVPTDDDAVRIACNAALDRGDHAGAERLLARVLAPLDRSIAARYDDGTELLGARVEPGVAPRLHLVFRAAGPARAELRFAVRSEITRRPRWSTVPTDRVRREVAPPFTIPTTLWRPGFLYELAVELRPRIGRERYVGGFEGPSAPRPTSGPAELTLIELPPALRP